MSATIRDSRDDIELGGLRVNLAELRDQKAALVDTRERFARGGQRYDHLSGILHLLDAIEDAIDPEVR